MDNEEIYEKLGAEKIEEHVHDFLREWVEREDEYYSSDDYIEENAEEYGMHDTFKLDKIDRDDWDDEVLEIIDYLIKIGVDDNMIEEALKEAVDIKPNHSYYNRNYNNTIGTTSFSDEEELYLETSGTQLPPLDGITKDLEGWLELMIETFPEDKLKKWLDDHDNPISGHDGKNMLQERKVPSSITYYIGTGPRSADWVVNPTKFFREAKGIIRSYKQARKLGDPKEFKKYQKDLKEDEDQESTSSALIAFMHESRKQIRASLIENQRINMDHVLATGEPDQDYDTEVFDAICNELKKNGYDCMHKEFDKYQGIYILVKKAGQKLAKFWVADFFHTGEVKESGAKYRKAVLIDGDGNETSANPGDYFMMKDDETFDGSILVLVDMEGNEKEIENPKKSDLPKDGEVQKSVEYQGEPDNVMVLYDEANPDHLIDVIVSPDGKEVEAGELLHYLSSKQPEQSA